MTQDAPDAPESYRIAFAIYILTCGIGTVLLLQGWTIETMPGKAIVLVKDDLRFTPRDVVSKLADGSMKVDEWKAMCASMRIEGVKLA